MTNISKPFVTFFIETMEMYLSVNKKINFTQMARFGRSCESRFRDDVRLRYIYRGPNDRRDAEIYPKSINDKYHLLYISIGTDEPAQMYKGIHDLHIALDELGINHIYYESPGTGHEWLTWRRSLHQFAPMLFKN